MKKNKRLPWIDSMKMFAILSVMIGHCSATYFGNEPGRNWVHHILIAYSMPLFFFISGITSNKSRCGITNWGTFDDYIRKIADRILIPSLSFCAIQRILICSGRTVIIQSFFMLFTIIVVLLLRKRGVINSLSRIYTAFLYMVLILHILGMFADLWFFPCLLKYLLFSALSTFFVYNFNTSPFVKYVITVLLTILFVGITMPAGNLEFAMYFFGGAVFSMLKFDFQKQLLFRKVVLVIGGGASAALFIYLFRFNSFYYHPFFKLIMSGHTDIFIFRQFAGLMSCFFFWMFFQLFFCKKTLFSRWGAKTLPLYGIHSVIITTSIGKIAILDSEWYVWVYVILVTVFMLILTCSITNITERYWMTKWIVSGSPSK